MNKFKALFACRKKIDDAHNMSETEYLKKLRDFFDFSKQNILTIENIAKEVIVKIQTSASFKDSSIAAFLTEYNLSKPEGIALLCIAEALLRIPDSKTANHLINDKISAADWISHLKKSKSKLVNTTTYGLVITSKILANANSNTTSGFINIVKNYLSKTSVPIVQKAVKKAMNFLGDRFVMGESIDSALKNSKTFAKSGYNFSFDMLGEAAITLEDSDNYFNKYVEAIKATGKHAIKINDIFAKPSISVKLSALYPRYENNKYETCVDIIYSKMLELITIAKEFDIAITIDAEEADRLDMSLDIFQKLILTEKFTDWNGIGLAVQAYQKRAFEVISWIVELAKISNKVIPVRLVKGAYWDYEIKFAQNRGLAVYPVFTRKCYTDFSFLACAKHMINNTSLIFPQFATHNAYTFAAIIEMLESNENYEFQCLHGMGYALYNNLVGSKNMNVKCRIYAPVGGYKELLPYLVRRLLENGANTSFIHQMMDAEKSLEDLIHNPFDKAIKSDFLPHSKIPLPLDIYVDRKNSIGVDMTDIKKTKDILDKIQEIFNNSKWESYPIVAGEDKKLNKKIINYNDRSDKNITIGVGCNATLDEAKLAVDVASRAYEAWNKLGVNFRANILEKAANLLENRIFDFITLLLYEAGKTIQDAIAEAREAIDYCRYYAVEAKNGLNTLDLPGITGETNRLFYAGRGVAVCISPWNFPLAIFIGQIVASLVAGNAVVAKPAGQTPLIGYMTVKLLHEAGIPIDVLHYLPGSSKDLSPAFTEDEKVKCLLLTGSFDTATKINQSLAKHTSCIVPMIAETGGQNAMIIDSSALIEQSVLDVVSSAFYSAGQRCSALRIVFIQSDVADRFIEMLKGHMQLLKCGHPKFIDTDIGPVIDESAKIALEKHAAEMEIKGKLIYRVRIDEAVNNQAFYVAPSAYEISDLSILKEENFGPILHIIRYKSSDLDKIIEDINNTGYGLTFGLQTRITEKIEYVASKIKAGNLYVNRNIIGAVVGSQAFGGENLSGTGPKAGGPNYLRRLCLEKVVTINTTASGGNTTLLTLDDDE